MRRAMSPLLLVLVLTACSSSDEGPAEPDLPAESAFSSGTCRLAAPDLLELGRTLPRLGDGASLPREVQQTLEQTQDRLFALGEGAEPEHAEAFATLVERIGAVRIRAVGNTYEPSLGDELQTSFDEVLSRCTSS